MYSNPLQTALKLMEENDFGAALEILTELHEANPREPQVNYWIGVIYLTHGHCDKAIQHLIAASKIAKKEAVIFATLADALNLDNRSEEAVSYARKAITLDRNSEIAYRTLGEAYARLRRPVMAQNAFEKAIKLNDGSAISHLALSRLKVSLGEMDQAEHHYRRAADLAPMEPSVLISAGDQSDHDLKQKALVNIEAILNDTNRQLSRNEAARLAFAAGKICDQFKDIPKAFHFFEKNRTDLYKEYDASAQENYFNRYKEVFSKEFFEQRRDFALSSERPVFVFGMPRSGTSLVESILSSHPKAEAAGELSFFEDQISKLTGGSSQNGALFEAAVNLDKKSAQRIGRKYLTLLDTFGKKNSRVIDKLPQNFEHLWLIALLFPNAHFCHVARNPADTCVSIYMTPLASKHTYNVSQIALAHYYGQYRVLMHHWQENLPVDMRTQSYEKLVTEPDKQRRDLVQHINLPWDDACNRHEHNTAQVFTFSMTQVRKPIYSSAVNRFEKYSDHIQPLINGLSEITD
jgi:Flp pilus assembly protein TadD